MYDRDLIFDIGAHDGTDTGYYLKRGFRVVAVDANPFLIKRLSERFAREAATGQLQVVHAAVTENNDDQVAFYISDKDDISSMIKEMSERYGMQSHHTLVKGRSLSSLFDEFGIPFYCKMDIEGLDASVVKTLASQSRRPAFLSCEGSAHPIAAVNEDRDLLYIVLDAMKMAGYSRFKLVDQQDLVTLSDDNHYGRLNGLFWRIRTKLEKWTGHFSEKYNNRSRLIRSGILEGEETSGLFGDDTPGEWADYETTKTRMAYHFQDYYEHTQNKTLVFWVDIHAR